MGASPLRSHRGQRQPDRAGPDGSRAVDAGNTRIQPSCLTAAPRGSRALVVTPAGLDGGLREPVLEADLAQPRVGAGHEGTLVQRRAEVARVRVGDDYPWILALTEAQSDEFVKAKLLWPGHVDDAVQRCTHRHPANRNGNIRS